MWTAGLVGFAIIVRIITGYIDKESIRGEIRRSLGRVISIKWNPFRTGWAGENGERMYQVRWVDSAGNVMDATAKTSLFTGVYWTSESVPTFAPAAKPVTKLTCLACAAPIPDDSSKCPACGWSYE